MAGKDRKEQNDQEPNQQKQQFLFPLSKYYGEFTLPNLVFDANLQEFAQKVAYVCNLEANGKISTDDAYEHIRKLWHELKASKQNILDDRNPDNS
jgi:hypothetical protein